MNKILLFILILIINSLSLYSQQSSNLDFFDETGFDKVSIVYYKILDKTSTLNKPLVNLEQSVSSQKEEKITSKKIGESTLTLKEVCKLLKMLKQKLNPTYSLDTKENITIAFYKDNVIAQNITISPNTKNLKVEKQNCDIVLIEKDAINPCLYLGKTTPKLEKFIYKLLKRKNLI